MSLGKNLQFLRKTYCKMTQEELAERLQVSRQTVSRRELDEVYPEVGKLLELCKLFSVSLDNLLREDLTAYDDCYFDLRIEKINGFKYIPYTVISPEPENDAILHMKAVAEKYGDTEPNIIGWDFPMISQEQINVYHMHGYTSAWVIPDSAEIKTDNEVFNPTCNYAGITIKDPMSAPFNTIPNAYKTLMAYMSAVGCAPPEIKGVIGCFERSYKKNGVEYMDVYMAAK